MNSYKKVVLKLSLMLMACMPVLSLAEPSPVSFTDNNETTGYVGLQWFTEETNFIRPNVVVGVRQTKTAAADNKITGYDLMFTYSLEKNQFDAVRAGYLDGKCNVLGTVGLGYSLKKKSVLGFIGAVGPYSRLIAELDGNAYPGLGLDFNSLGCAGDRKETSSAPG